MPHYRKPLAIAIALAVAAGAAGTAVAKPTGPEAAAKAASRAKLMAEHRGGTLRLRRAGRRRHARPADQLHAAVLAALPVHAMTGCVAFKKAAGTEGFKIVPDLAEAMPDADRRRQDLDLQAAQGHQVLQRQRC